MRRPSLSTALLVILIAGSLCGCATQRGSGLAKSRMPRKEVQFYNAQLAESGNQLERARQLYESLYKQDPSNSLVCYRLGSVHTRQGNYDAAKRYLREGYRLNSNNPEILNDLGYVCYLTGDLAGAQEALGVALKIDPTNPRVNNTLALLNGSQHGAQGGQQQYARSPQPLPVLSDNPAESAVAVSPSTTAAPAPATPVPAANSVNPAEPSQVTTIARIVPAVIPPAAQLEAQPQPEITQSAYTVEVRRPPPALIDAPIITPKRSSTFTASVPDSISPRAIVAGDYLRLCNAASGDVKSLLASMNSQQPEVMKTAILQLGVMGNKAQAAAPAIRLTLNHANPYIRIHSALALWRIEQNLDEIMPVFVSGLRDTSADVRAFAAAALEMGPRDTELITPLTGALSDSSPFVRLHAAAALYQFSQQQTTAAYVIVSHLTDREANVRWLAAFLLGETLPKSEITVQALTKSLQDSDNRIRIASAFALAGLGGDAASALPELKKLSTDRQPEVRKAAEEALRDIEQNSTVAAK